MTVKLHQMVKPGSEKARIWRICDTLLEENGRMPTGREVVDIYAAEGGNEGSGFSQYSHWKKALEAARSADENATYGPASELAEAPAEFEAARADDYYPLCMSSEGRLVLPKALRDAMMLDPDGRVTAHVEDGELRIISPLAAIRRVQRIAQKFKKPGVSVVDELIAERRAEAAREDAEA